MRKRRKEDGGRKGRRSVTADLFHQAEKMQEYVSECTQHSGEETHGGRGTCALETFLLCM